MAGNTVLEIHHLSKTFGTKWCSGISISLWLRAM